METEVKSSLGRCRCCLQYGCLKYMWGNHKHIDKTEVYGEMLTECYKIDWFHFDSEDHNQICEPCILKLREAYNFRIMVLSSQRQLINEICDDRVATIKVEPLDADEMLQEDLLKDSEFQNVEYLDPTLEAKLLDEKVIKTRNVKRKETTKRKSETTKRKLPNRQTKKKTEELNNLVPEKNVDKIENFFTQDVSNDIEAKVPKIEFLEMVVMNTDDSLDGNNDDVVNDDNVQYLVEATEKSKKEKAPKPPKIQKKPREHKRFLRYTEEDLRKGVEAVKNNRMSRLEAAEYYNVPRKTLTSKLKMDEEDDEIEAKEDTKNKQQKTKLTKLSDNPSTIEMRKHRENIETILQNSNATLVKDHRAAGFSCCFCTERFQTPALLKQHNINSHEDASQKAIRVKYVADLIIKLDVTGLRCLLCAAKISSLEEFTEHLLNEHKKRFHVDIKSHIIPFKFDTEAFECVTCKKQFKYFKLLAEHMNDHYRNYECVVCGRGFVNKQAMQLHSYRHQKNVGQFKCPDCSKIFDTRPRRSDHVRLVHRHGRKTRCCHLCQEKFVSAQQVQRHLVKSHGVEPQVFKCDACEKSYNGARSLEEHKKRYHLMLRPHPCSLCEMSFYSKVELNSHMVTHTKTREFQCALCDKRFGTKCSLNQHMRAHYGIKRYKCDRCDLKFAAKNKLRAHSWKKHGESIP